MTREEYHVGLDALVRLAVGSRWERFWRKPTAYVTAIAHRELVYPRARRPLAARARLFWGESLEILLPGATDIYLTGGKSHASEIRLARLLIERLRPGDTFVDVGAHYGYFAALAASLVGASGEVVAVEAAPATVVILRANAATRPQVRAHHLALAAEPGQLTFYEFPHAYAEYNSFDVAQYARQPWFEAQRPRALQVMASTLDDLLRGNTAPPRLIKIDVEGGEPAVLRGAEHTLRATGPSPLVVIEYLDASRGNAAHREAEALLRDWGYRPHAIDDRGGLCPLADIEAHLRATALDSDNVAFARE